MKKFNVSMGQLSLFVIALGMGGAVNAALTVQTTTQPSARIAWGGEDNLREARSIMYNNTVSQPQVIDNQSVRRVNNGYSTITNTSTGQTIQINSTPSYSSSTQPSASPNLAYGGESLSNYGGTGLYDQLFLSTRSSGVMVIDAATGHTLYEKNANTPRAVASITKILTAMVVLDGGQSMHEEIVLTSQDFRQLPNEKSSGSNLRVGDRLNRAEMLLMTLMKSENPAAKALARTYPGGYDTFMREMNRKAQSLGMTSSYWGDPSGLDVRNVASPNDLVKMVQAASQYDVIRRFSTTQNYSFYISNYNSGNRTYRADNTSVLVRSGSYPIGLSKTGYIRESGRCVVMETQVNNRPAIIVLLGANTSDARWADARSIMTGLSTRRV